MIHNHKLVRVVLLSLFSALSYSTLLTLLRYVDQVPVSMMLFVRFIVSLLWIVCFGYFFKPRRLQYRVDQPWVLCLRIASAFLALSCIYFATRHTNLVNVTLLSLTYPLFIPLLALLAFRIKTSRQTIVGIIIGFAGVLIFLHPNSAVFHPVNLLILLGSVFAAIAVLSVRHLSKTNSIDTIFFYYYLVAMCLLAVVCYFHWQSLTLKQWGLLLLTGIVGTAYQDCLGRALSLAPASTVSPIMFTSIVFSGIFDWWLWKAIPSLTTYIGTVVIVLGIIILLRNKKGIAS